MATTANQPFAEIITLEQFLAKKGAKPQDLKIAKTTNGSIVLNLFGSPCATIKNDIKGTTAQETAAIWKTAGEGGSAINLCFGIPQAGSIDQMGRPSLPCAMKSTSQWEEVAAF